MIEGTMYQALRGEPQTVKQLAKKTKLSDEEVEAALADFRGGLWLETDDSGKEPKFSLTQQGRSELSARYPDS